MAGVNRHAFPGEDETAGAAVRLSLTLMGRTSTSQGRGDYEAWVRRLPN